MAIPISNIESGEWNMYDRKHVRVTIPGATLAGMEFRFVILTRPSGEVLLEKTGDDVELDNTSPSMPVVDTTIGGTTPEHIEQDYASLYAGVFFWELYELQTPLKIANGYATIGHGIPAE